MWAVMVPLNVYCWLVVWSMFNELTEVSRLEDIADLKVSSRSASEATRQTEALFSDQPQLT